MRAVLALAVAWGLGCATTRAAAPATTHPAPALLAAALAEADRLASRGCYLCLKEAAAAYASLLEISDDRVAARRALETNLMLALREVELRMPDSGARGTAEALLPRVTDSYDAYFAALDALAGSAEAGPNVTASQRAARLELATELEKEWPANPMKAYFYLAASLNAGTVKERTPELDAILNTHSQDLSLQYRLQAFPPAFSEVASRALIGQETGFGEVHFLLGQRAVLDARPPDAYRELSRARVLLPDSASIALALANVAMGYARYAEALGLYEQVLAAALDADAQLGRAKALGYLGRNAEAVTVLDALLQDPRDDPAEQYYWRAWNRLRLSQSQAAYADATAALKAMRTNEVHRLAGMASFNLIRLNDARDHFEHALQMNGSDCDAQRYLGQIDAAERRWKPAFARFTSAVACYDQALARMAADLAGHEQDISGLSNGLIAGLRAEIKEAQGLRTISTSHADLTARNAGLRIP